MSVHKYKVPNMSKSKYKIPSGPKENTKYHQVQKKILKNAHNKYKSKLDNLFSLTSYPVNIPP
ncbi:hypothetical protein LguiB_002129 [Lonicera macranthoides]